MSEESADIAGGTTGRGDSTQASAADPHAIEFRVVSFDGIRHSLKLERIFWTLLEAAASAERERLGAYISKVVAGADTANSKSSVLRAHAADWMRRKLVDISSKSLARKSLQGVVLAAPTPCFVVTAQNAIEMQNEAFLALLSARAGPNDPRRPDAIRITFRTDIKTLRERFREKPASFLTDQVIIHIGGQRAQHQARIASIDAVGGQVAALLVYIVA
jgi:predicted DNA-binding ribbon-helix-helix protein